MIVEDLVNKSSTLKRQTKTDVGWQSYDFLTDFTGPCLLKYSFKNKIKISRQSLNEKVVEYVTTYA